MVIRSLDEVDGPNIIPAKYHVSHRSSNNTLRFKQKRSAVQQIVLYPFTCIEILDVNELGIGGVKFHLLLPACLADILSVERCAAELLQIMVFTLCQCRHRTSVLFFEFTFVKGFEVLLVLFAGIFLRSGVSVC